MNICPQCLKVLPEASEVCPKCGFAVLEDVTRTLSRFDLDETHATKILSDEKMTPEKWQKLKALFEAAQNLLPEKREKFLQIACGNDVELRREFGKLLGSLEESDTFFLEEPVEKGMVNRILEKEINAMNVTTGEVSTGNFVAGTVLADRYRIIGLLGRGGMGEVYKAEDIKLDQMVALKFLPDKLSKNEDALKRFIGEVRTARQVSHENVCRVFDISEINGKQFISMEFIEGDDLSQLLKRIGRLPSDKAVEISRQICMGLNAIHKTGILHRDLKPANIIIDSKGKARITDFGIAGFEHNVQGAEARVGTPAYMSPEQIIGKEVTQKSDIYSLGLLIYEIFTGKQAVEGNSLDELIEIHQSQTPTNPSKFVENINPLVEKIISRCLEKDPQDRPASAVQVALALPGGDPLQVALEAGETPSPEMVAAAPTTGAISRTMGLALLGVVVTLFLGMIYVKSEYQEIVSVPLTKSPEVLAERAGEITRRFGYTEQPVGVAFGYDHDHFVHKYADEQENPEKIWAKFRTGQPALFKFDVRRSPKLLIPMDEDGPVTAQDPPMLEPGMVRLELDVTGRLLKFTAVPFSKSLTEIPSARADWQTAFEEAGLRIEDFTEIPATATTLFYSDEQKSWKGSLADNPEIPVTVAGSALEGRITNFEIVAPWSESTLPGIDQEEGRNGQGAAMPIVLTALLFFTMLGAVLLARHNIKNKRGDVAGAVKLALVTLLAVLVSGLMVNEFIGDLVADLSRIFAIVALTLFPPVIILVLYLAIEPPIRKRFPDVLISWNRILAGNFTNPLIGRDILIGLAIGLSAIWLEQLVGYILSLADLSPFIPFNWPLIDNPDVLIGVSRVFVARVSDVFASLFFSFFLLFMFLVSFIFVKNRLAAAAIAIFVVSLPTIIFAVDGGGFDSGWFIMLGAVMFCLLRFGLVSTWAFLFAVPSTHLYTFDPGKFFFKASMFVVVTQILFATAAFIIATRGEPWFRGNILEDIDS